MRKNLLASAAVLGGLFYSGLAMAQSVTSPALLPDARGLAGGVNPPDNVLPAPGSVVVRFGGQMDWYAVELSDSADRFHPRDHANRQGSASYVSATISASPVS